MNFQIPFNHQIHVNTKIAEGFYIDNSIPSEYVKLNIHALVTLLLQPLRTACGHRAQALGHWPAGRVRSYAA